MQYFYNINGISLLLDNVYINTRYSWPRSEYTKSKFSNMWINFCTALYLIFEMVLFNYTRLFRLYWPIECHKTCHLKVYEET